MSTQAPGAPQSIPAPKMVKGRPQCPRCGSWLLFDTEEWTCVVCGYEFASAQSGELARLLRPRSRAAALLPLLFVGMPLLVVAVAVVLLAPKWPARMLKAPARPRPATPPWRRRLRPSMFEPAPMREQQHVHPTDQQDRRGRHPR